MTFVATTSTVMACFQIEYYLNEFTQTCQFIVALQGFNLNKLRLKAMPSRIEDGSIFLP